MASDSGSNLGMDLGALVLGGLAMAALESIFGLVHSNHVVKAKMQGGSAFGSGGSQDLSAFLSVLSDFFPGARLADRKALKGPLSTPATSPGAEEWQDLLNKLNAVLGDGAETINPTAVETPPPPGGGVKQHTPFGAGINPNLFGPDGKPLAGGDDHMMVLIAELIEVIKMMQQAEGQTIDNLTSQFGKPVVT